MTNLEPQLQADLFQKEEDLFEKYYRLTWLGRKPYFLANAFEKELKLS